MGSREDRALLQADRTAVGFPVEAPGTEPEGRGPGRPSHGTPHHVRPQSPTVPAFQDRALSCLHPDRQQWLQGLFPWSAAPRCPAQPRVTAST